MHQEFPFRPRGKHGFDREDVMNFISQRQQAHSDQLSQIEELEAAKNAWYTQAKTLEREKNELATQCQSLEEQLSQVANAPLVGDDFGESAAAAELNALKSRCFELDRQITQRDQTIASLEQNLAQAQADGEALPAPQLEPLEDHLNKLAESAEEVTKLQAELAAAQAELQAIKAAPVILPTPGDDAAAQQLAATQAELFDVEQAQAVLQSEYNALAQQFEQCQEELAQLQQQNVDLAADCDSLRMQLDVVEQTADQALPAPGGQKESSLRGMVLSSFNYANLYVDNNMKTAQLISESTSRNISHVNEASANLLNQVEAIAAAFDETTCDIRQQLTTFRQELTSLQEGMNYRLSKDRFAPLLEENERLRARIESELNAEFSAEESAAPAPQPVPFAEELPETYQSFMDAHQDEPDHGHHE
ncbi:MAG: hypothetical protein FWB76_02770 [Oscillospiraceae bacterium]|nr:hypothetical protein [Oscillospiraceae bacterium]